MEKVVFCYTPTVGGDIDGDSLPELFAIGTTTGDTWYGANVFVFMGTGETKKITCNTTVAGGSIALGKVKTTLGDTTLVFLLNMDQYIYAYSYHQGNFVQYWKSATTVPNTGAHNVTRAHTLGLADFNNMMVLRISHYFGS